MKRCIPVTVKGGNQAEKPYWPPPDNLSLHELGGSEYDFSVDESVVTRRLHVIPQSTLKFKRVSSKSQLKMEDIEQEAQVSTSEDVDAGKKKKEQGSKNKVLCICCVKELTKADKIGKPFPKFRRCIKCGGTTCINCNENNICHECLIHTTVKIHPDELMSMEESTLRRFLELLHYDESHFVNFQKAHLVKQILVRYRVHEHWDPTFYLMPTEPDIPPSGNKSKPDGQQTNSQVTSDSGYNGSQKAAAWIEVTSQLEKFKKQRPGPEYDDPWPSVSSIASSNMVALHTITSPAYFEQLTIKELMDILHQYKETAPANAEKHELKFKVLQLWNKEKKKANEIQNIQYGYGHGGGGYSPKMDHYRGGTPTQYQQPAVVKTVSLQDIPSSSAIDKIPVYQLKTLLQKHNENPDKYQDREAIIRAVRLLWNKAKREVLERQNVLADDKYGTISKSRQWKSQESLEATPPPRRPLPQQSPQTQGFYRQPENTWSQPYGGGGALQKDDYQSRPTTSGFKAPPPPPPPMPTNSTPYNPNLARSTPSVNKQPSAEWPEPPRFLPGHMKREVYGVGPGQSSTLPRRNPRTDYQDYRDPSSLYQEQDSFYRQEASPVARPPPLVVRAISLQDLRSPEDILSLNIRQMLLLLEKYGVNVQGITDKTYLEEHVRKLWFSQKRPGSALSYNQQQHVMQPIDRPIYTDQGSNYSSYPNYQGGSGQQRDRLYSAATIEQQYATMSVSERQYGTYDDDPGDLPAPISQHREYYPQDDDYRRPSAFQPYQGGRQRAYSSSEPAPQPSGPRREYMPPPPPPPLPSNNDMGLSNTRNPLPSELCSICNSRPLNSILLNCAHRVCCSHCGSQLDACPLCHQEIVRIITI